MEIPSKNRGISWAELNPDILRLISKKLGELSNFVRFRAVCKLWRSHVLPSEHPPQLPWFIEVEPKTSDVKFFPLYSNKTRTLHIPQAEGMQILGPSKYYVFITNSRDLCKSIGHMNPLTKSCFTIYEDEIPLEEDCMQLFPIYIGPDKNPNSSGNKNSVTVVFYTEQEIYPKEEEFSHLSNVIFWRSDNDIVVINFYDVQLSPRATEYHDGRVFLSGRDTTTIVDVATRKEVVISNNGMAFDYLIKASGDLLGVIALPTDSGPSEWCSFEVYQLIENDGTNTEWVKMENGIGNHMLFLCCMSGFSLEAGNFDGMKGNCIYFTRWNSNEKGDNIFRYDLENEKTEAIPTPDMFCGTWFIPSLR